MGSAALKPLLLNDASRLYNEPERKDEFVVARHFVEAATDKRRKEPHLVEEGREVFRDTRRSVGICVWSCGMG